MADQNVEFMRRAGDGRSLSWLARGIQAALANDPSVRAVHMQMTRDEAERLVKLIDSASDHGAAS